MYGSGSIEFILASEKKVSVISKFPSLLNVTDNEKKFSFERGLSTDWPVGLST